MVGSGFWHLSFLQAAGLIKYSRGHIVVLDRPQMEARVCECYAVVKRETDRLLVDWAEVAQMRQAAT